MKIISGAHRAPGKAFCSCGTVFEFDYDEIIQNNVTRRGAVMYWYHSIYCPVCNKEIELPTDLDSVCPWIPDKEEE